MPIRTAGNLWKKSWCLNRSRLRARWVVVALAVVGLCLTCCSSLEVLVGSWRVSGSEGHDAVEEFGAAFATSAGRHSQGRGCALNQVAEAAHFRFGGWWQPRDKIALLLRVGRVVRAHVWSLVN